MKSHRIPLVVSIVLPTILLVVLGQVGIYVGAYMTLRESAYEDALYDDRESLKSLNDIYSENNYGRVDAALKKMVSAYQENCPEKLPEPGSAEEKEYKDLMEKSSANMLYYYLAVDLERYVSSFVGIFFEDTANNRMVLACSSNTSSLRYYHEDKMTALYLGAFFDKTSVFDEGSFYGISMRDRNLGEMIASGMKMYESTTGIPYWLIRQTEAKIVYATIPSFTRNFAIVSASFTALLLVILLFLMHFLVIRRSRALSKKAASFVDELSKGNTSSPFDNKQHRIHDEVTDLNNSFFFTQEAIKDYSAKLKESTAYEERINAELALAERIQSSLVPSAPLYGDGFKASGYMRPAKEVGGDFFDYFKTDDNHLCFYIGDVSGKGVPAALFMARACTLLRMAGSDFGIEAANRSLCQKNEQFLFVTAFFGVIDLTTGILRYVNAGHEPVYLRRKGKFIHLNEEANFMLGCIEDFEYVKQTIQLEKGDRLFMYTDGVSEATNVKGELYGKEHIMETLNKDPNVSIEQVSSMMFESIKEFEGEAEQFDDACVVVVDYLRFNILKIEPSLEGLAKVAPFLDEALKDVGQETRANIQVSLDELCSNLVFYSEAKTISLSVEIDDDEIALVLTDDGKPFNPVKYDILPDFTKPGGMGIEIVKSLSKTIQYERKDDKNILSITFAK